VNDLVLAIAAILAIFSIICFKAGKKGFGLTAGIVSILVFITFLRSGPGFELLDWMNDPSVDVPDNIPIPGGK
jgi:hypothetical protein